MRKWRIGRWRGLLMLVGLFLSGCDRRSSDAADHALLFSGISLKVGALDDVAILAGVSAQRGEWQASRKGEVSVRDEPLTVDTVSTVDVVLFPAQRLGDLVNAGVLAPIASAAMLPPRPSEDDARTQESAAGPDGDNSAQADAFQYMDIAPAFREEMSKYGPERFALPCGGSALVLVYRRDVFESDSNRQAAIQAGLSLDQPPANWPRLDALAKFFEGRDWNGDGKPDHGIALALGADTDGVGDATFLARAASLGLHRDHYSFLFDSENMAPRIDTPPFVEALRGLVSLKACGPPGIERFDAAAARQSFRAGEVAILIDRAERAAAWSFGKPVGVAPLPGSDSVFEPAHKEWRRSAPLNVPSYLPRGGGWLVGINGRLSATQREAALDFAKYLVNPENSNRMRAERSFPMLPVRTSQMSQGMPDPMSAPDVDPRLWSDAVSRTLLAERVVAGLRIPGADGYLSDLTKGRVAAAEGQAVEKALSVVAKAWEERTKAAGPKRQLWHYRRSLNLPAKGSLPSDFGT